MQEDVLVQPNQSFRIMPILEPDYILPDLPRNKDSAGMMFLLEDYMLLGVARIGGGPGLDVMFLDLRDGKLIEHDIADIVSHENVLTTRGWRLLAQDDDGERRTAIEFEVPPKTQPANA